MKERTFKLSKEKTRFIRIHYGEQSRLAAALQIKQARFSHYMHGTRDITESLLMKLCQATNRKPSDFLDHPAEKILADASFSA